MWSINLPTPVLIFLSNLSFSSTPTSSQSPAEQLPFESSQVDLVTAMTAAHWFDGPRFLKEVERVLKPNGCLALLGNKMDRELEYGDATSAVNNISQEVIFILTFISWYISHGTKM